MFNRLIQLSFWPCLLLMCLLIWPVSRTLWRFFWYLFEHLETYWAFLSGAGLAVLWVVFFRVGRGARQMLYVFEHELTHALFAVLSFHRVDGLYITREEGGSMHSYGQGNWLITLSPYFFPTLCLPAVLLLWISAPGLRSCFEAFLGVCAVMHVEASLKEFHLEQSDLKKYGQMRSWALVLLAWPACFLALFWLTPSMGDVVKELW